MHSNHVHDEPLGARYWVRIAKRRLAVLAVVAGVAFAVGVVIREGTLPSRPTLYVTGKDPAVSPSTPARPIPGLAHFADNAPLVESIIPATGRAQDLPR